MRIAHLLIAAITLTLLLQLSTTHIELSLSLSPTSNGESYIQAETATNMGAAHNTSGEMYADGSEKHGDGSSESMVLKARVEPTPPPGPFFSITVSAESKVYVRGEHAIVYVKVRNIGVEPAYFYILVTFISPSGKHYPIVVEPPAYLSPGYGVVARKVSWVIPEDAELGEYKIAVDCIQDPHNMIKYRDDFTEHVIFTVVRELAPIFHVITVEPSKESYYLGETVSLYMIVENIGNIEGTFYLSVTVIDPAGLRYELDLLPPKVLYPGSRAVFSNVKWEIPADATPGSYAVEIDFIRDPSTGEKWEDTFTRKALFRVSHLQAEIPREEEESQLPQIELKAVQASIAGIEAPDQVVVGEESYLKAYVANTGEVYIVVRVVCNATDVSIDPSYILVRLEPGATGEAVFKLIAESEGTLNVSITLAHGDYVLDTRVIEVKAVAPTPPATAPSATPEITQPTQPQAPPPTAHTEPSPQPEPSAAGFTATPAKPSPKLRQPELNLPLLAVMAAAVAVLISLSVILRKAAMRARPEAHSYHSST